jgi:hypothetical protein
MPQRYYDGQTLTLCFLLLQEVPGLDGTCRHESLATTNSGAVHFKLYIAVILGVVIGLLASVEIFIE